MKIIFLDIDGVLNNAKNPMPRIDPECIAKLNRILDAHHDAKIIVSSNWRFFINRRVISLSGLELLLQTHGANVYNRLAGTTPMNVPYRSEAILAYLEANPCKTWIALDDDALDLGKHQHRAYQLDGQVGLTEKCVGWAIRMLEEEA